MKNKIFLLIILILLSCSNLNMAGEKYIKAEEFLHKFLRAEFIGDNTVRAYNAIYATDKENYNRNSDERLDLIYQFQTDLLCAVDHYEIDSIKKIGSKLFYNLINTNILLGEDK